METIEIDAILDRHRERVREFLREIVEEELGESPFRVPLDQFLARPEPERAGLVRRAARVARARVERELEERGACWIVLVGDEVATDSTQHAELPTVDEVLALGREQNLVPYLFEAPLIEEIPATAQWAPVATGIRDDRYPTLPVRIGGTTIDADLDTGAHGTFADARIRRTSEAPHVWFAGRHLGRSFEWSPDRVEVAVALARGSEHVASLPVRWVRDWDGSPFVRINPQRRVLVGRDLLRGLGLEVSLRAVSALTEVIGAAQGAPSIE